MAQGKAQSAEGLATILQQGGNTLLLLITMSIFTVALTVYLILTIRAEILAPHQFIVEAEEAAQSHDYEALNAICKNHESAAAQVIGAAALEAHLNPNATYQVIRDAVEDEGSRQASALWQKIQYLMDIAVVAPMIGLLGTVLGMRHAFTGIGGGGIENVRQMHLADGVSKALITTAAGLILGIGSMVIYAFFRGRVNRLLSDLEDRCGRVLRIFIAK